MSGAALEGPLAAPAPDWANKFGAGASGEDGAAADDEVPGGDGAVTGGAPGCVVGAVSGAVGQGTHGWHQRRHSWADDSLGAAAAIPTAHNAVSSPPARGTWPIVIPLRKQFVALGIVGRKRITPTKVRTRTE